MSKLADQIRRAIHPEPAPMGFAPASRTLPPTMLLVAITGDHWTQSVRDAVAAGADLLLLAGRPSDKDIREAIAAADERPCGVMTGESGQVAEFRDAGADFVVLELETHASALLDEKLGFMLHVRGEQTDVQLRTIEPLPLDALFFETEAKPTTIARQMELQRVSGLSHTALLLPVHHDAGQDDLLCLRDAGVTLLSVDLKDRGGIDAIKRLRGVIDALPRRQRRRREERPGVALPGVAAGHAHAEEEDDEE